MGNALPRHNNQILVGKTEVNVETQQITEEVEHTEFLKWLDRIGYIHMVLAVILGLATIIAQVWMYFN